MASGGRVAMSEPRKKAKGALKVRQSNLADNISEDRSSIRSNPSLQEDRPNNWDFSDWRPSSMFDSSKRIKKENPEKQRDKEKEKGQSLMQDSPERASDHRSRHRTPSTFPRTKITANTPASQRLALEKLKTQLNFSDQDDVSNDGERNNERNVPIRRERPANYTPQETLTHPVEESGHDNRPIEQQRRDNRNVNIGEGEPDSNHIVGRLMQIRGYIKQASNMKQSLLAAGGDSTVASKANKISQVIDQLKDQERNYMDFLLKVSRAKKDQLLKLQGLIEHLREQESGYMSLLEKMLSSQMGLEDDAEAVDTRDEDTESVDLAVDAQSEASEATTNFTLNGYTLRPQIEECLGRYYDEEPPASVISETESTLSAGIELEASESPFDLIAQKTKELDVLEAQQTSHWDVLTSEAKVAIEEKNSELDALRQQRDLLKKMLNQQKQLRDLQGRQVELLQMQRNAECDVTEMDAESTDEPIAAAAAANMPISDQGESDESNNLDIVPKELKELRQKLDYLRNIYQNYPKREEPEPDLKREEAAAASESDTSTIPETRAAKKKRDMLQNKLNDLQEKKESMDTLLSELHSLRQQRYPQINNDLDSNKDSGSVTSSQMKMESSRTAADLAQGTIGDAAEVLEMLDAQSKVKKLEEVRDRLSHLKDLVQYYETGNQFIHEPVDNEDQSSLPALSDYEDPELMKNLKAFKEDQALARMLYQNKVAEEEEAGSDDDDEEEEEEDTSEQQTESEMSLGPWGEDPEIQEKVKKLKDAKERLKRLQHLVNAVQHSPQAVLPEDLAELVASLDGDLTSQTEQSDQDKQDTSYMASEGEVVPGQMSDSVYEAQMNEQRGELNNLLHERHRLLGIQEQLQKLYEQFPDMEAPEAVKSKPAQNGNSSNGSGRVRQPVTFQEPPEVFTNDELYDKMRRQRILREELRQKKRELEAIMRKGRIKKVYNKNQDNQSDNISYSNRSDPFGTMSGDFTTAATWGGSTTENLEEGDERKKKQNNDDTESSTTSEEDDAYPSDGIVQVEEEEEQADQSDGETYTVEDDELLKQGPCVRPPNIDSLGMRGKTKKTRRDNADGRVQPRFNAWGSGTSLPKQAAKPAPNKGWSRPTGKGKKGKVRQENYRSPEDIVRDEGSQEVLGALQRQLETTTSLCHSLLRDQQALNQMLQGGMSTPGVLTAGSPFRPPYYSADPMSQLTQQQLQYSLQQCQQQMYQQHIEMMQLQQQMANLLNPMDSRGSLERSDEDFRNPYSSHSMQNPFRLPPTSFPSPPSNRLLTKHTPGFNLSPVFPSGFAFGDETRHASTSMEGGREVWNKSSAEKKKNKGTDTDEFQRYLVKPTIPDEDVPKLNLEEILNSKKKSKKPAKVATKKTEEKDSAVIGRKFPSGPAGGRATAMAKLSSKKRPATATASVGTSDLYRPGLSAHICGTAFQDNASQSSMVSSARGGERFSLAKLLEKKTKGKIFADLDSDVPSNLSLFEALRETIYSEVATLISQNENRPHFLIEIFRELQMLSSDYLRQRALYSIQDLVTRFLTDDSIDADSVQAPRPLWLNTTGHTASEQTPSESLLTSEEEQEYPARDILKMNGINISRNADVSQQSESLQEDLYDYIEKVDSVSSLSTPTSTAAWENPFAQDSLGDTVIHLDKAMQRMREYERKLALAGGKDPDGASPQVTKSKGTKRDASEALSSSAQDPGSESSTSEVQYPRIDTHQLDLQIKGIMTEVIPILKEHMDTVCSPQLLGYIKQIVLDLTKQGDEGQEFVRFFHKQLGTLIQDSLSKFEGRKLAECGEDLLVDMSEVLFNELAFFRLMQDLDDPALSTQRMLAKWRQDSVTSGTEVSTQDGVDGEMGEGSDVRLEYETTEKSDSGDDSDDEAENIEEATKATITEEEDLGKMRDDEFAGVVEVAERDDDSERNSSMMKVELAMSETKPYTRIGSDEDDEFLSDESHGSVADPSETAVSREIQDEEEADVADGAAEKTADNGDDEKDVDELEVQENAHVNGQLEDEEEIGVDDLPPKLNVDQEMLERKMLEEELSNGGSAAALSMNEVELIGDPLNLKEPDVTNSTEL